MSVDWPGYILRHYNWIFTLQSVEPVPGNRDYWFELSSLFLQNGTFSDGFYALESVMTSLVDQYMRVDPWSESLTLLLKLNSDVYRDSASFLFGNPVSE